MADKTDYVETYIEHVRRQGDNEAGLQYSIGGEWGVGIIERELLIQYGLQPKNYVIDLGCGAGRLAKPLSEYLTGRFLGLDIVPTSSPMPAASATGRTGASK